MKPFKHWQYVVLLTVSLCAAMTACKKDPDTPTPNPTPPAVTTITGIDPATAPIGSTIVITGTNFNTNPASNTITINGVPASVVSVTDTRLVVVVPTGASNGPVVVKSGGQTVQSAISFTVAARPTVEKRGTIRRNEIWRKDSIYILRGMVYIPADFTLTIEPGTIIKGTGPEQDPDGKGFAGTLVIERRGKLIANGTATQPIVFTSSKPANQRNYGDWGGIFLSGKAQLNRPGTTPMPGGVRGTTELYHEFNDNSGSLQYVRIEFAGATQPVANGKLDGLTMHGMGWNTNINHVQVSYSGNDAFKWYGGVINTKYLFAYRSRDDDFSVDQGYTGRVQFGVGLRDTDVADLTKSNGIESQNFDPGENVGAALSDWNGLPQTAPIFTNISLYGFSGTPSTATKGAGVYQAGVYLSRNTGFNLYNSVIVGYPEGIRLEGTTTGTLANINTGSIDLQNIIIANTLTPVVGGGDITTDQATAFVTTPSRTNQVIPSSSLASLLLNTSNFSLTAPNFVPQAGSPLLRGAIGGGKLANENITPVTYKGAFGTDNWLQGWTNFDPQNTNYDR